MQRTYSKKGFTLIEMLLVIGIILTLVGASVAGFSRLAKRAERAKAQELVSNACTALTALFQKDGVWPEGLLSDGVSGGDGLLDANHAAILARRGYLSLSLSGTKLTGVDKLGLVTPWASAAIKRLGVSATEESRVGSSGLTVRNHMLHFALDLDGDGKVVANVGGETVNIRATAAVWCIGKDGGNKGTPWPYSQGKRHGDVYSWAEGQTKDVK